MDKELLSTRIDRFLVKAPVVKEEDSAAHAIRSVIADDGPGATLVVNQQGEVSGIVTKCDVPRSLQAENKTAASIATKENIVAVRNDAELWQLLKIINGENRQKRVFQVLPVVDSNRKPVGLVTRKSIDDILREVWQRSRSSAP